MFHLTVERVICTILLISNESKSTKFLFNDENQREQNYNGIMRHFDVNEFQ